MQARGNGEALLGQTDGRIEQVRPGQETVLAMGLLTIAAPWLMRVPALHDVLAALGCVPAPL